MAERRFKAEGIVIRKVNVGEADQILTLLTREHGKISCVAKGARRITSKFCGRVELMHQIRIVAFRGKGDLHHLNEAEVLNGKTLFELDAEGYATLGAVAEVTHRLIQDGQSIEGAYLLLSQMLHHLKKSVNRSANLQAYILNLLVLLGFIPELEEGMRIALDQQKTQQLIDSTLRTILGSPLKSEALLKL